LHSLFATDKTGKPLFSWRAEMLPYMEDAAFPPGGDRYSMNSLLPATDSSCTNISIYYNIVSFNLVIIQASSCRRFLPDVPFGESNPALVDNQTEFLK
jgi:hypothetical protein